MSDTTTATQLLTFPAGFLWGTATASHQIEGGNWNNDWWAFEHKADTIVAEPSGDACDSWNRWREDLKLVADMGLNAYRFSVEWSRIEPEPGLFSLAALDHYKEICTTARDLGILPVVTFHHFSSPRWLAERGGFEWVETPDRLAAFVARTAEHLGDEIGMACTINEPNIVTMMGYVLGAFPPGVSGDFGRFAAANATMVDAHRRSVEALRAAPGSYPVGLTLSMADMVARDGGEQHLADFRESMEDVFLRATTGDDFIGVQCYTRLHFDQNGFSTSDDAERVEYVTEALASTHAALRDGVDIRGYVLWSLLDNFEWAYGYGQHFGLVACDRQTFVRTPKGSAGFFGSVASSGSLQI